MDKKGHEEAALKIKSCGFVGKGYNFRQDERINGKFCC